MFKLSGLFISSGCLFLCSHIAFADDFRTQGSFEQAFTSGKFLGANQTRDRFTRVQGIVDYKNWTATVSYWAYPYCGWFDLDETTLAFASGNSSFKAGRFLPPIAQVSWDDQWYSGFVYVPLIEGSMLGGRKVFERTSAGVQWDVQDRNQLLIMSMFGSNPNYDRLAPKKLDRAAIRYQVYRDGVILGASYMSDTEDRGAKEQVRSVDFRWTKPQWMVRGSFISYLSPSQVADGFFVDIAHRPKGWTDVTGLFRIESFRESRSSSKDQTLYTAGAKVRLPLQASAYINYSFGPSINKVVLGGGWAVSLTRTYRF